MRWPQGPLKEAGRCPWCGLGAGPEPGEGFGCEHELPLQAIERTLEPDGYPDHEAAVAWLDKTGAKWDPMALFNVSIGVSQWNSETISRRHQKRFRIGAVVFWISFVLVLVAEAWHLLR